MSLYKCRLRDLIYTWEPVAIEAESPHIAAEKFVNRILKDKSVDLDYLPSGMMIAVITTDDQDVDREVAVDIQMEPVAHGRMVEDPRAKETPR